MITKSNILSIFVASFLFFPNIHYRFMFVYGITFLCLLSLLNIVRFDRKDYIILTTGLLIFIPQIVIRWIIFPDSGLRDLVEFGRILFLLLSFCTIRHIPIYMEKLTKIIKIYIIFDFVISIMQFFHLYPALSSIIEHTYSREHHIENSLGISNRALGLSSDPSSHGLMILILITILLLCSIMYQVRNSIKTSLPIIIMGIFSILTSQSQTAFIGLLIMITVVFFFYSYQHKNRFSFYLFFVFLGISAILFIIPFLENLQYLTTLFSDGLGRSSYILRIRKRELFLDMAMENPIGILLGYGKDYFGQHSAAMDNEHLYIFLVYGLPVYILFCVMLLRQIVNLIKGNRNFYLFAIPILIGIPLAWSSSYYLSPKIMFVLTILYAYCKAQTNNNFS